jgi:hypothetical protein
MDGWNDKEEYGTHQGTTFSRRFTELVAMCIGWNRR